MVRVRAALIGVLVCVVLALCAVRPAAAQNTVNQTTCGGVTGLPACLTNGFIQDLSVDCSAVGAAGMIGTALAQVTDRDGPNRITVSGTCNVGANIVGFNRLTIHGNGATITKGTNIINSRNVLLQSLTFDFATAPGQNLNLNGSQVTLDGVTVKNSTNSAAIAVGGSGLGFSGTSSLITANGCNGMSVGAGSVATIVDVTISNNGAQQTCGSLRNGIFVPGGSLTLATQTVVNGSLVDAPPDISGNSAAGISVEAGIVRTNAEAGTTPIHIHNNVGAGIELFGASTADLEGHLQFDGNSTGGSNGFGPAQIVAALGANLFIGAGAVVQGGLAAAGNSSMVIGDGGGMTLTGGATFAIGSVGFLSGVNTIDTLTCDPTSWAFNSDSASVIGTNTCPSSGPAGLQGPAGPVGPQGPPGPVTTTGSFTATGAPGFLAEFSGPTNIGTSALFDSGGLVGVGTTVPADKLHVSFTNTSGTMTGLAVQNMGNTASSYSGMLFYDQTGALGQFQGFNNVTHEYRINNIASTGSINFMLGSSSKFLVASNGSVGIGATSPAARLQVLGDVRLGTAGTNGCVQAFDGSPIGGTCSSDARLKRNIQPFERILDKVAQLQPVSYEWRPDEHPEYHFGSGRTTGLIAQEVERVFPGMVAEDERGYKAVNYSQLPLLLLQAVRELKVENEHLRSEMEAQRRQLQSALDAITSSSR